jgi:hypothetical protein
MRTFLLFLLAGAACGQQLDLSSLDKLADKAGETSLITLDGSKLKLASQFLSSEDQSQQKAKDLITGLKGIFVRTFEFEGPNRYSSSDLDPVRKQLTAPGWSNIIMVKERNESSEVWLFSKGEQLGGIAIIAAEPDEISVVNIVGPIDLNALSNLAGSFGIPKIDPKLFGGQRKATTKPDPPKKEDDDED